MSRTVGIGIQDFGKIVGKNCFYIDKTHFIKEWWESEDEVTLIARPRRFGKTLTMSMLEYFFSVAHAGEKGIFEGLKIWKEDKYHELQGTYPVISLSFANVKEKDYKTTKRKICQLLTDLYNRHAYLLEGNTLTEGDRLFFRRIAMAADMEDSDAAMAINHLAEYMSRYYGRKVIILLDEYDTPMQEAYVSGFWENMAAFTRSMFNAAFKTNPYMERAVMTGITRVSKESIFSDLNNLKVITTTSNKYADAFGFTEEEVFAAMDEYGMYNKDEVKSWYDGFVFGNIKDIYNPWSVINLLDTGKTAVYWANTSANSLVGKLIREGGGNLKERFEELLKGKQIKSEIDEEIVYNQLDGSEESVWSLLLASGYLKVEDVEEDIYSLTLTNHEVELMFAKMVKGWFRKDSSNYNLFIKALMLGDTDAMNEYMNRVTRSVFSYFDTGGSEPERFYHGFVLGLLVELSGRYTLKSNRESGFGRYDVMLEPFGDDDAIIIEFKVFNSRKEKSLEDTLNSALSQIEEKQYGQELISCGIPKERIRKYGFAFQGKNVLIG